MSAQLHLTNENLADYLKNVGVAPRSETLVVERVGDGNINWVRRVRGASGSRVVKQARPALERFPQYQVSTERIVFEARFYETVGPLDADRVCPTVLAFDAQERVLVLEDIGDVERLDAALERGADVRAAAATLGRFLGTVHRNTRGGNLAERFANDEMRRLHGDHIFVLPYRSNDFPLSDAIAGRARAIQADRDLLAAIDAAYARYLECRDSLVHGDVQPANVLLTSAGPRLVDAEIAHVGDPAFDMGQLVGHLLLPAAARGEPAAAAAAMGAAWTAYREAFGPDGLPTVEQIAVYAGVELLRRTIGAARVPAVESDAASRAVLDAGTRLIRDGLPPLQH